VSPPDLAEAPPTVRTDPPSALRSHNDFYQARHDFGNLGATEVRAPLFSPEDLEAPPAARFPDQRAVLGTLRSEGFPADLESRIAEAKRQADAAKHPQPAASRPSRPADPLARGGIWRPPPTPIPPPPVAQTSVPTVPPRPTSRLVPVLLVILGVLATTAGFVWILLHLLGR
jgi:hypothetical protein